MKQVNYILVNETSSKSPDCVSHHSNLRDLRHYLIVNGDLSAQRDALLKKLVQLRLRYPNAKILGVSEIDGRNIHPSAAMNALRREMSDLP